MEKLAPKQLLTGTRVIDHRSIPVSLGFLKTRNALTIINNLKERNRYKMMRCAYLYFAVSPRAKQNAQHFLFLESFICQGEAIAASSYQDLGQCHMRRVPWVWDVSLDGWQSDNSSWHWDRDSGKWGPLPGSGWAVNTILASHWPGSSHTGLWLAVTGSMSAMVRNTRSRVLHHTRSPPTAWAVFTAMMRTLSRPTQIYYS